MNKKGVELNALPALAILLVVTAVALAVGSDVVDTLRQDACTSYNTTSGTCSVGEALSYRYNASDQGLLGLNELSQWQDTIGLVIGAAVIIGLVLSAFKFSGGF